VLFQLRRPADAIVLVVVVAVNIALFSLLSWHDSQPVACYLFFIFP